MLLPNTVVIHILEYLRGDILKRKRCVHTVRRGKKRRTCKNKPVKDSTFCCWHEKQFASCENFLQSLERVNEFMLKR